MTKYKVQWEIEVKADSPQEAAYQAAKTQYLQNTGDLPKGTFIVTNLNTLNITYVHLKEYFED
jgi:hypothetical protein